MFEQRLAKSPRKLTAEAVAARWRRRGGHVGADGAFKEAKNGERQEQHGEQPSGLAYLRPPWDFTTLPLLPPEGPRPLAAPSGVIQLKLEIGAVDDPLEREADAIADKVMRMPDPALSFSAAPPQISRKCAACEKDDEEKKKLWTKPAGATKPVGAAPSIAREALRDAGRPLDSATRAFFEPRFARDFSAVRLHASPKAAQSAAALGARAYTVGSDIVLAADQPTAPVAGRRLLAHELAHVVQQSAGDRSLRRQDDNSAGASRLSAGGGCRKTTRLSCPGTNTSPSNDFRQCISLIPGPAISGSRGSTPRET